MMKFSVGIFIATSARQLYTLAKSRDNKEVFIYGFYNVFVKKSQQVITIH